MKKYVLGTAITLVFLAYSLVLRHQHSEPVVAPVALSQNTSTSSAPAVSSPAPTTTSPTTVTTQYKDGTYDGSVENAFYGNVQISATIQNGKITAVDFLEYPNDNPNSINVNQQAMPFLKQEAVRAQSANVSVVTGATLTSQAFTQSLANALRQAKQS